MSKTKRKFLAIAAICGAGTVFQIGLVPGSCQQFYLEAAVTAFDWCSVFNCTDGTYFDLGSLFLDSPQAAAAAP